MQNNQYDPEYNRNLITAFLLISVMMGLWYYFYEIPHRKVVLEQQQKQAAEVQLKQKEINESLAQNNLSQAAIDQNTPAVTIAAKTRDDVIASTDRVKIQTDKVHGSINLTGLKFDDVTLAKYKETILPNSRDVTLLSPSDTLEPTFIEFGWYPGDKNIKAPDADSKWKLENGDILSVGKPVTFSWDNGAGLKFLTKISIDENYMFTIEESVQNNGQQAAELYPYGLINKNLAVFNKLSSGSNKSPPTPRVIHTGPVGVMDGTLKQMSYDDLRKNNKQDFPNSTGWIGITDKYWAKTLIPDQSEKYNASFKYATDENNEKFQVDYVGQKKTINPDQSITYNSKIFAGAKELKVLDAYRVKYNIPLFERLIDFGWLYILTKPLMGVLLWFYAKIGNIGLSILALTLCVKLVLFPLARKSYISMGRLKDLQPKMKVLKEQYGKDKMEINRRTMELYKKEKINPASGCLPLLLQIPIFLSLYKVFSVSIEMLHTPFYGWIHDLSAPDPTSALNLFGLIPITLPHNLAVFGAWPVLYMLTMFAIQKISPAVADPTQAKMLKVMPILMGFYFSALPAALVIYYTFNNSLTVLQQLYFLKFHSKD